MYLFVPMCNRNTDVKDTEAFAGEIQGEDEKFNRWYNGDNGANHVFFYFKNKICDSMRNLGK